MAIDISKLHPNASYILDGRMYHNAVSSGLQSHEMVPTIFDCPELTREFATRILGIYLRDQLCRWAAWIKHNDEDIILDVLSAHQIYVKRCLESTSMPEGFVTHQIKPITRDKVELLLFEMDEKLEGIEDHLFEAFDGRYNNFMWMYWDYEITSKKITLNEYGDFRILDWTQRTQRGEWSNEKHAGY